MAKDKEMLLVGSKTKEALKEASKLRTRIPEDTKKALDKAKIEAKRMLREAGKE